MNFLVKLNNYYIEQPRGSVGLICSQIIFWTHFPFIKRGKELGFTEMALASFTFGLLGTSIDFVIPSELKFILPVVTLASLVGLSRNHNKF